MNLSRRHFTIVAIAASCMDAPYSAGEIAPFMWRIDFTNASIEQCERYLRRRYPKDQIVQWGEQSVFPVVDNTGSSSLKTAYIACVDHLDRVARWRAAGPPECPPILPKIGANPRFDGAALGRGLLPYCCDAHAAHQALHPGNVQVLVAETVDLANIG